MNSPRRWGEWSNETMDLYVASHVIEAGVAVLLSAAVMMALGIAARRGAGPAMVHDPCSLDPAHDEGDLATILTGGGDRRAPLAFDERADLTGKGPRDAIADPGHTALHEAAHAVSAIVMGIPLRSVDTKARRIGDVVSCGFTDTGPLNARDVRGKGEDAAMPHLVQKFAGPAAELCVNKLATRDGPGISDFDCARRIAAVAICDATQQADGSMLIPPEELRRNESRLCALLGSAR